MKLKWNSRWSVSAKILMAMAVSLMSTSLAFSEDYPNRPIRVVVAFPPGGGLDVFCRMVTNAVSKRLGQTLIVDNRPGANGDVGTQFVARAAPDGYTISCVPHSLTQNGHLNQNGLDVLTELTPIAKLADWYFLLAVRNEAPFKDFKSFLEFARGNPGHLKFAASGASSRVTSAFIAQKAGIKFLDVPFPGAAPAITALLSGTVDVAFVTLAEGLAGAKDNQFRILASISETRNPLAPDIPAVGEYFPGIDLTPWYGIAGPAGMSQELVEKLNIAFTSAVNSPETKSELESRGYFANTSDPKGFSDLIKADYNRYGDIIKSIGLDRK